MHSALALRGDFRDFQEAILAWYKANHRKLPWRSHPTVYKTVVSEFMLQQTQVNTVLPYFDRWINRFPDFTSLAAAPESEVLKHWEGLGYYRRARNLHKLAQTVAPLERLPQSAEEWQKLPGIGPYTAAAIASIALGESIPVIDGNVIRVISRLTADETPVKDSASAQRHFRPIADQLLAPRDPGNFNQAMMELGATICTKHKPLCLLCPVAHFCHSAGTENATRLPLIHKKQTTHRIVHRAWIFRDRLLLLEPNHNASSRLQGIYELPALSAPPSAQKTPILQKSRGISNERLQEKIYALEPDNLSLCQSPQTTEWISLDDLPLITLSGPHRKWIQEILNNA